MTNDPDELRDLFTEVTGTDRATESQQEGRGSLVGSDDDVERIRDVLGELRERFSLWTDFSDEELVTVVRGFFAGADDAAIAEDLGVESDALIEARLACHLWREEDVPDGLDVAALRERLDDPTDLATPSDADLAAALDADEWAVRRARLLVAAHARARSVSHRYRAAFEDAVVEGGLSTRLTESAEEDGLWEATEDIDSLDSDADVGF